MIVPRSSGTDFFSKAWAVWKQRESCLFESVGDEGPSVVKVNPSIGNEKGDARKRGHDDSWSKLRAPVPWGVLTFQELASSKENQTFAPEINSQPFLIKKEPLSFNFS